MLWSMYKPGEYFPGQGQLEAVYRRGPILINLIHEIDLLRYLTNDEIKSVYAETSQCFEGV